MNSLILNIETATNVCSVALAENGNLLNVIETTETNVHSSKLTVFIEELMTQSNMAIDSLNAVAVSMGPGSYTGLRIGVSVSKGICYALNTPLVSVNTLQSMAYGFALKKGIDLSNEAWICPMIDARRMEVYSAFFDIQNKMMKDVSADIINENSYQSILDVRKVYFFGNGSEKCKNIIKHKNALFINNIEPSARYMISLSNDKFVKRDFENTAYFEPCYLKDFIATIPKKNIFK